MSGVGGRGVDGRGGDATLKGYQLEVETFLKGSAFLSETRKQQSTLRETEWEDVMLWAEREPDGVVVVHAEFDGGLPVLRNARVDGVRDLDAMSPTATRWLRPFARPSTMRWPKRGAPWRSCPPA